MPNLTRRDVLTLAPALLLASRPTLAAEIQDDPYQLPPLDLKKYKPAVRRTVVEYPTRQYPGTIIIDTSVKHLFVVLEGGKAIRYGIAVGKDGFRWGGAADIARKVMWPKWTPPSDMIQRKPELAKWRNGMPGGPDNPLGARAMYLYQNGRDTLYRIHGTSDPSSIGTESSSGCIRMFNQDVVDLYRRAPIGTRVLVYSEGL